MRAYGGSEHADSRAENQKQYADGDAEEADGREGEARGAGAEAEQRYKGTTWQRRTALQARDLWGSKTRIAITTKYDVVVPG